MTFALLGALLWAFPTYAGLAEGKAGIAGQNLQKFDQSLSLHERKTLKQVSPDQKDELSPRLKELFEERQKLKEENVFWGDVIGLKEELLKMPGANKEDQKVSEEAELIAKTAIEGFGDLRKKYEMLRPAFFHNILVNVGAKDQGLCWHWTRDLTRKLKRLSLTRFDLIWATAHDGTIREHNTVVVVSQGHSLEDGVLLDGWRHSGKPFWTRVSNDKKYPWKLGSYHGNDLDQDPQSTGEK